MEGQCSENYHMKGASKSGAGYKQSTHPVVHDDGVAQWVADGGKMIVGHHHVEQALSAA